MPNSSLFSHKRNILARLNLAKHMNWTHPDHIPYKS